MRIKISTLLQWPIQRQIYQEGFEDVEFFLNQPVKACDAWIVYQGLFRPESTICPPENVILFTYEPPSLHQYQPQFLKQFSKVITCHRNLKHPRVIYRHQAQPWLAGVYRNCQKNIHSSHSVRFTVDDFVDMQPPDKTKLISVLCSDKVMTDGHRTRLKFVHRLKQAFGNKLDVFGYGFQPLADKWDALHSYKYHIVLENSVVNDYWTEKLADAYLAYCFPLISGCPNLEKYFPEKSHDYLNLKQPNNAIKKIERILEVDSYYQDLDAIIKSRNRILNEYNLFNEIRDLVQTVDTQGSYTIKLKDERLFLPGKWLRSVARPIRDKLNGL